MELTDYVKRILLNTARESIKSHFNGHDLPDPDYNSFPELALNAGAFVTLSIGGSLRGCIGYIQSDDTLYETIGNAARHAAFNDPRFPPLRDFELDHVNIEISVLSPSVKLESNDDIKLGMHGLILNEKGRRALLLPQVPVDHHMNRDQFLSALCEKAGFHANFWREKQLNIETFTATVFSEKEERRAEYAGS